MLARIRLLPAAVLAAALSAQAATYYVDSASGDDGNAGTSAGKPWKTLRRVNGTTFAPGDRILLRAGGKWSGPLAPQGSGSPGQPIVIDRYGEGGKPLIEADTADPPAKRAGLSVAPRTGAVLLVNQQHWEISHLEIVNRGTAPGVRRGVCVSAENFGTVSHIWLRDLHVHHVEPGFDAWDPDETRNKLTAGIGFYAADDRTPTRFDDLLIEGCEIDHIDHIGITTSTGRMRGPVLRPVEDRDAWHERRITNMRIRGNRIHHISRNAIVVRATENLLAERNVIHDTALKRNGNTIMDRCTKGSLFQYNEAYRNMASIDYRPDRIFDGSMFNPDALVGAVYQYNYSHENATGILWAHPTRSGSYTLRYNIDQNAVKAVLTPSTGCANVTIHNNTFFVGPQLAPRIIFEKWKDWEGERQVREYQVFNNIFYVLGEKSSYLFQDSPGTQRLFERNCFFAAHPAGEPPDPYRLVADPRIADPGGAATGLEAAAKAYRLLPGSAAAGAGVLLPGHPRTDFAGRPVAVRNGRVDLGALSLP
jgi:hypothetical protein